MAVFTLTGCGGDTNVQPATYSVTKVFSDGAGVFTGTRQDGSKAIGIAPDITAFVAAANEGNDSSADLDLSSFPIVNTYSGGVVRSGAITNGNFSANFTIYDDNSGDVDVGYLEIPNTANMVMATAEPYTAPSGAYSYTGLFIAADRTVNPTMEYGTFNMTADFSANSVSFNGQTNSYLLTGSAVLDSNAGTFNSNSFRFEDEYYYYSASIYGLMGGADATATTGVFHTNDQGVDYAGAFVGQR